MTYTAFPAHHRVIALTTPFFAKGYRAHHRLPGDVSISEISRRTRAASLSSLPIFRWNFYPRLGDAHTHTHTRAHVLLAEESHLAIIVGNNLATFIIRPLNFVEQVVAGEIAGLALYDGSLDYFNRARSGTHKTRRTVRFINYYQQLRQGKRRRGGGREGGRACARMSARAVIPGIFTRATYDPPQDRTRSRSPRSNLHRA